MRDAEKTIGNLIDKQSVAFISSIDEEGFPNTKAMLPPRIRECITLKVLLIQTIVFFVSQQHKEDFTVISNLKILISNLYIIKETISK